MRPYSAKRIGQAPENGPPQHEDALQPPEPQLQERDPRLEPLLAELDPLPRRSIPPRKPHRVGRAVAVLHHDGESLLAELRLHAGEEKARAARRARILVAQDEGVRPLLPHLDLLRVLEEIEHPEPEPGHRMEFVEHRVLRQLALLARAEERDLLAPGPEHRLLAERVIL